MEAIVLALISNGLWPLLILFLYFKLRKPIGRALDGLNLKKLLDGRTLKSLAVGMFKAELADVKAEVQSIDRPRLGSNSEPEATKALQGSVHFKGKATLTAHGEVTPANPPPELFDPASVGPEVEEVEGQLLLYAPVGAIIAGWTQLEGVLRTQANRFDPMRQGVDLRTAINILEERGVLEETAVRTIRKFQNIRNQAAHLAEEISDGLASDYLNIRDTLILVVTTRFDALRVQEILGDLGVQDATLLELVPTRPYGFGMTREMARTNALSRRGKWVVRARGRTMHITEQDARALAKVGANYSEQLELPVTQTTPSQPSSENESRPANGSKVPPNKSDGT